MGPKRSDRMPERDLTGLFCEQAHKPHAPNEGLDPEAQRVAKQADDRERKGRGHRFQRLAHAQVREGIKSCPVTHFVAGRRNDELVEQRAFALGRAFRHADSRRRDRLGPGLRRGAAHTLLHGLRISAGRGGCRRVRPQRLSRGQHGGDRPGRPGRRGLASPSAPLRRHRRDQLSAPPSATSAAERSRSGGRADLRDLRKGKREIRASKQPRVSSRPRRIARCAWEPSEDCSLRAWLRRAAQTGSSPTSLRDQARIPSQATDRLSGRCAAWPRWPCRRWPPHPGRRAGAQARH